MRYMLVITGFVKKQTRNKHKKHQMLEQKCETCCWCEYAPPPPDTFNVFLPVHSLCFKERSRLSVDSVVNAHGTTLPWSSTCGPMVGLHPTSAPCVWSSAAASSPCRGTSRATPCRTSPLTGASTRPTCTSPTYETILISCSFSWRFSCDAV